MSRITLPAIAALFVFTSSAVAQGTPDENAVLNTLDPSRTIGLMRTLSEGIVRDQSGAGVGTAVAGSEDEKALTDFIENEMTGLRLREDRVDVRYGFSENVFGKFTGSEFPDEYVAVTAHHDCCHDGAHDDAIGVAVMLEIARTILEAGRPRRTLLLISFGAEEAGGIGTQSAAANALADVATMGSGKLLSNGTYMRESLYAYDPANWGNGFEHDARAVGADVYAIHENLNAGGSVRDAAERIGQLETQARGFIDDALLIITGKLRVATDRLREVPIP